MPCRSGIPVSFALSLWKILEGTYHFILGFRLEGCDCALDSPPSVSLKPRTQPSFFKYIVAWQRKHKQQRPSSAIKIWYPHVRSIPNIVLKFPEILV